MKERLIKGDKVPFAQIANSVLCDPLLSLKGKGLYAYLFSKPDNWEFSSYRIRGEHVDGRDSILSGLRELERRGYLRRKKLHSGRVDYTIYRTPRTEKPAVGNSVGGETPPINNKELNKQREEINIPLPPLKKGKREILEEKLNQTLTVAQSFYEEAAGREEQIVNRLLKSSDRLLNYVGTYLEARAERGDFHSWRTKEDYLATLKANLTPLIRDNTNVSLESFTEACERACSYSRHKIRTVINAL